MSQTTLRKFIGLVAYPKGSIYCTTRNLTTSQVSQLWGGTWEKIEGRFLYGGGDGDTLGSTGGSADAVIPLHYHTLVHTHTVSTTANHQHIFGYIASKVKKTGGIDRPMNYNEGSAQQWTDGNAGYTGAASVAHTHTTPSTTVTAPSDTTWPSVTNGNLPPLKLVNMYVRTSLWYSGEEDEKIVLDPDEETAREPSYQ